MSKQNRQQQHQADAIARRDAAKEKRDRSILATDYNAASAEYTEACNAIAGPEEAETLQVFPTVPNVGEAIPTVALAEELLAEATDALDAMPDDATDQQEAEAIARVEAAEATLETARLALAEANRRALIGEATEAATTANEIREAIAAKQEAEANAPEAPSVPKPAPTLAPAPLDMAIVQAGQDAKFVEAISYDKALGMAETLTGIAIGRLMTEAFDLERPITKPGDIRKAWGLMVGRFSTRYELERRKKATPTRWLQAWHVRRLASPTAAAAIDGSESKPFSLDTLTKFAPFLAHDQKTQTWTLIDSPKNGPSAYDTFNALLIQVADDSLSAKEADELVTKAVRGLALASATTGEEANTTKREQKQEDAAKRIKAKGAALDAMNRAANEIGMGGPEILRAMVEAGTIDTADVSAIFPAKVDGLDLTKFSADDAMALANGLVAADNGTAIAVMLSVFRKYEARQIQPTQPSHAVNGAPKLGPDVPKSEPVQPASLTGDLATAAQHAGSLLATNGTH